MPNTTDLITRLQSAINNAEVGYNRSARLGDGITATGRSDAEIVLQYRIEKGYGYSILESRAVASYCDGWTVDREAVTEFLALVGLEDNLS